MTACHPYQSFTPVQYTNAWLRPPASATRFREVHRSVSNGTEDMFVSGVWAPRLPVLRPLPSFAGAATPSIEEPDSQHEMGKEQAFTGGTFRLFCSCQHPKCVSVVFLDFSESQRMPTEFIVQRCKMLRRQVIHDFACASLKVFFSRLPYVSLRVGFCVDRFHWHKNHVLCSK